MNNSNKILYLFSLYLDFYIDDNSDDDYHHHHQLSMDEPWMSMSGCRHSNL